MPRTFAPRPERSQAPVVSPQALSLPVSSPGAALPAEGREPVGLDAQIERAGRLGHHFGRVRVSSPERTGAVEVTPASLPSTSAGAPIQCNGAQDRYDAAGREKWREFIDAKDHAAAEAETRRGLLSHPGEYYDYHRDPATGARTKKGDHWKAFQDADAYVSRSIAEGTHLDAREYYEIHQRVAAAMSPAMRGWRDREVTWGLRDPTPEKVGQLRGKGLGVTEGARTVVTVPAPRHRMQGEVQALFDEYHALKEEFPAAAATELYEKLELLHPTKDASSRTHHLILNRLLAEYGLSPAILHEPNTPEQSYRQNTATFLEASRRGHEVAMRQPEGSVEALRRGREEAAGEEDMDAMVAAMMAGRGLGSISRGSRATTSAGSKGGKVPKWFGK